MSAIVLASTENMPYEDWLEYRRRGIGGSDTSVVCGVNRYKSPVELWLDKTGQLPQQEAENLLKEMMGENEVGTIGERIITWKSVSQERLDSKTLKAEHPALYKKYTNQTTYRRFSIKAAG